MLLYVIYVYTEKPEVRKIQAMDGWRLSLILIE